MNADAQQQTIAWGIGDRLSRATMPADESPGIALTTAERFRATLLGTALATLGLAAVTVGGLLIVTGPFHTSLGSIA